MSANDYHLSATSPAIDAGSSLGAPNVDIEDKPLSPEVAPGGTMVL